MSKTKLTAGALSYLDDLLRGLRGEAIDATPKLGSGKNLEALQRMQDDIADAARKSEAPSYPKNIVQDDLAAKQGFTLEGQPYTKEGTIVPEGTDLPALRTQTLPETPSSFEPGTIETPFKKITEADELAKLRQTKPNYTESVSTPSGLADTAEQLKGTVDFGKTTGEKARDLAVLGASGLALTQLGNEEKDDQTAVTSTNTPENNRVSSPENYNQLIREETTGQPLATDQLEKQPIPIQKTQEVSPNITEEDKNEIIKIGQKLSEDPNNVAKEEIDYIKMLMSAQENDNQSRFITNLLRAGTTIGAAIAGVKPDYSGVDSLQKQIGTATKQVGELMSVDSAQKKLEAAQRELNDDKKMRDAQSEVSKSARDALRKAGYPVSENTSAMDIKNMGINVSNIITQKMSQDAALKRANIVDQAKLKADELKETKSKQSFIAGAQKVLLKPFQEFQKVNSAYSSVEQFAASKPSGPKDVAMLYDFIKVLDPNSAVKEGEIVLTRQGMSLFDNLGLKVNRITSGELLNDNFRRGILEVGRQKRDQAAENYRQVSNPFITNAASLGMSGDEMSKFDYMSSLEQKRNEISPKQQSDMVRVQRIKDGSIKLVNRSQTLNMDKNKYKILDQ